VLSIAAVVVADPVAGPSFSAATRVISPPPEFLPPRFSPPLTTLPTPAATRTYTVDVVHMSEQWSNLLSGGFASTLSKTVVFPFDLVRKRLQVQGPTRSQYVHRNIPAYVGVVGTLRDTVKHEGVRGLYKGLAVSLVKTAPLSAVTMWTMENSLKIMEWVDPSTKTAD